MTTPPWDPPLDTSGGFIVFQYTNGSHTHRMRVHVAPFNKATRLYLSAHGTENGLDDTSVNFIDVVKPFYTAAWSFSVLSEWHWNSGVLEPVLPPTVLGSEVGTSGGSEAISPDLEKIINGRSSSGGRYRFTMIEAAGLTLVGPSTISSSSSGATGAFMAYVSGANTGVVAHDGGAIVDYARQTVGENRRLRRAYRLG